MTLHAFTVVDNSIAVKSFVGDENTVQKFEGELFQLVIFSCFAILQLYKIILLILTSQLSAITSFFSDHVFFVVGNLSFLSRNNW